MKNKIISAWLRFAHRVIFARQLDFGIFFLKLFGDKKEAKRLFALIENSAEGTLGRSVWDMLHNKHLDFVPSYENHDLKHALLGYRQEAPEEIRMQAFMFGNAGFSLFSIATFLMFILWTPDVWLEMSYHYRCGSLTKPIGHWRIEAFAHRDLEALRLEIGLEAAREKARHCKNDQTWGAFLAKLKEAVS
jgi:hypothetical protein